MDNTAGNIETKPPDRVKPNFTHYAKTIIITSKNRNEAQESSADDEQFSALPVQMCCPVGREANFQSGNTILNLSLLAILVLNHAVCSQLRK